MGPPRARGTVPTRAREAPPWPRARRTTLVVALARVALAYVRRGELTGPRRRVAAGWVGTGIRGRDLLLPVLLLRTGSRMDTEPCPAHTAGSSSSSVPLRSCNHRGGSSLLVEPPSLPVQALARGKLRPPPLQALARGRLPHDPVSGGQAVEIYASPDLATKCTLSPAQPCTGTSSLPMLDAADAPSLVALAAELQSVQQRLQQVESQTTTSAPTLGNEIAAETMPLFYASAAGGPQQRQTASEATWSSASAGMLQRASSRLSSKRMESAENLHQATSTICLSDNPARKKVRFLLASFVVVALQLMVTCGILIAALSTACVDNSQCPAGWFCTPATDTENPQRCARCQIVGQNATEFCTKVANVNHPRCEVPVSGTVRDGRTAAWEGGCWDPSNNGDAWLGDSFEEDVTRAVDAMKTSDWLALLFASSIASLSLAGELREIKLCQISSRARKIGSQRLVRNSLWCLSAIRQFGLLPALAAILPNLVLERGSTALDICFNTLAVLFLLDADNLVFAQFLGETTRAQVAAAGQIELSPGDTRLVSVTRQVHATLIPIAIIVAVWSAPRLAKHDMQLAGIIPLLPFIIGFVAETWVRVTSHERGWQREVAKGLGSLIVGYATFMCFFFFVAGGTYGQTWKHGQAR